MSIRGSRINGFPSGRQYLYQDVPYSASLTLDPAQGSTVQVGTLTGDITIQPPTNPQSGDVLVICFVQDGTGNRAINWDAVFDAGSRPQTNTAAGGRTQGSFVYSGGVWQ
jgi:hypothetical protein